MSIENQNFLEIKSKNIGRDIWTSLCGFFSYAKHLCNSNVLFERCVKEYNITDDELLSFKNAFDDVLNIYKKENESMFYAIKTIDMQEINKVCNSLEECSRIVNGRTTSIKHFPSFEEAEEWLKTYKIKNAFKDERKQKKES